MKVEPLAIPEVKLLTPRAFGDERGFFLESFNARVFADAGLPISVDRPVTKFQDKAAQVGREIHEFVWERVEEGEVR